MHAAEGIKEQKLILKKWKEEEDEYVYNLKCCIKFSKQNKRKIKEETTLKTLNEEKFVTVILDTCPSASAAAARWFVNRRTESGGGGRNPHRLVLYRLSFVLQQ
jgi:hypothetical protein